MAKTFSYITLCGHYSCEQINKIRQPFSHFIAGMERGGTFLLTHLLIQVTSCSFLSVCLSKIGRELRIVEMHDS